MKTYSDRPWLRGGNRQLNFSLGFVIISLFMIGAKAQDIGTLNDGANTAVTIKHRLELVRVQLDRNGNISWFYQRVKRNNADDTVITREDRLREVTRPLSTFVADSWTINSHSHNGQELVDFIAKAGHLYYQADNP